MTAAEIVEELKSLSSASIKKVLLKHGIPEPLLGVKVEDLKKIQKRIKKDYQLALDLYDTGIYDAMYLAGLIADDRQMTIQDLQHWVERTTCQALCGFTVAWVAAESLHGWDLAREWIESKKESTAVTGWATLSSLVAIKDDADLDLAALKHLLLRVPKTLHQAPNGVRYAMNNFVIAVGTYVQPLSDLALQTAQTMGEVAVDFGDTACQVPSAVAHIEKVRKKGTVGRKRKTAKC
ncbi:MAG: DNA alkylation repair protein [Planctomycetia bacterium]|nr:DNA alkylation repair protein [Planctomycetia bacterium]